MNGATDIYQAATRPLKIRFLLAAALCISLATVFVSQQRTRRTLEAAYGEHLRARDGLLRVREAIASRKQTLARLGSVQQEQAGAGSPERLLYGWVDAVKERLRPEEISITGMDRKGNELSLRYTLTLVDAGYCDLLNAIGSLQRGGALLTPIESVTLARIQRGGRGAISATVKGTATCSARNQR